MKNVQLNLSTNLDVLGMTAAPVIPSPLRPWWHGVENLTDLSVLLWEISLLGLFGQL